MELITIITLTLVDLGFLLYSLTKRDTPLAIISSIVFIFGVAGSIAVAIQDFT